jgi:hypothetical protein
MSSGVQGNYVDQAWAQNLPGYFKDNVKPSIADDAFLIPRANIAIPDIVTMSTVGSVGNRGFIDSQRTRLSTIRNAILNPSTYVKRLHPSDPTSGTGGIDNLSNLSRFGQPLPFADAEDFPDFKYWSRYTKDSGTDPLTAGYAVKTIGAAGEGLAAAAKADRKQSLVRLEMSKQMQAQAVNDWKNKVTADRRLQAERMGDAAALAAEEVRQAELDALDAEDGDVEFVGANATFNAAAAMARGEIPLDENDVEEVAAEDAGAGENFAAAGEVPAEMGAAPEAEAAAGAVNEEEAPIQVLRARALIAMGYNRGIFAAADTERRNTLGEGAKRRFGHPDPIRRTFFIVYQRLNPDNTYPRDGYMSVKNYDSADAAANDNNMCRYRADLTLEIGRKITEQGYAHFPYRALNARAEFNELPRQNGVRPLNHLGLDDAGSIGSFRTAASQPSTRSGGTAMSRQSAATGGTAMSMQSTPTAADEENYDPGGGDGNSAESMSIAQSIAARSGVRNTLRDQAPILGPNSVYYQAEQRANIAEVQTTQTFMGSTTGNPAAIFSNAYIATPAFKRAPKRGIEGEYVSTGRFTSSGRPLAAAQWGSMFEPRVEQTTAASGDIFSTAEREADPRFALLHGRKPSAATFSNPNLAYESGTMRQLESQSRSNRLDGNVDGPAEQSSLAIQNPTQARNMASRLADEFARAPPETRQTSGVLNKNQRIPVSSVTVARRASLTSDPATAFRAGKPTPRR